MQFVRLQKAIDIAERVLPELVADWIHSKSVQNININIVQKLSVNMLILWVIKWSKS
jgi:broad specificity polyphosphatase/5'/3'-nucleotidase SurE